MAINNNAKMLRDLVPQVRDYALFTIATMEQVSQELYGVKITPTVTSGFRSLQKQKELYDRRASNPYPVEPPGNSAHNYGLAFDSDVPDRYMPAWIAVRRYLGWSVPDNDEVHAGVPNWRAFVQK